MKQVFIITTLILGLSAVNSSAQMQGGMMGQDTMMTVQKKEEVIESSEQEGTTEGSEQKHIKSGTEAKKLSISNGEGIYYTGFNEQESRIEFKEGPMWLRMHGGSCVSCHGETGKGGVSVLMGTATPTDIRYRTLTVEEHAHGGVKEEHPRYTDELIKRAVTQGLNPAGKPLDKTMPRYKMTEEDLDDLIEYIKTLK
ncbi:MAG: cytochrome c [Thermodesulfovibrionia bacterium]